MVEGVSFGALLMNERKWWIIIAQSPTRKREHFSAHEEEPVRCVAYPLSAPCCLLWRLWRKWVCEASGQAGGSFPRRRLTASWRDRAHKQQKAHGLRMRLSLLSRSSCHPYSIPPSSSPQEPARQVSTPNLRSLPPWSF